MKISANSTLSLLYKVILAIAPLLLWQNCAREEMDDLADNEAPYTLTLSVMTENVMTTRADRDDDFEEAGSAAENYIDIDGDDLRLFIFTNEGDFLMEIRDIEWEISNTPTMTIYTMPETEIVIPRETEEDKVKETSIRRNGINVLALANSRSAGWSGRGEDFPAYEDLMRNRTAFNFDYAASTGNSSWIPDIATKKLIPMFGMIRTKFNPNLKGNYKAVGQMKMQRALAKIEVIDDIQEGNAHIYGVTLSDYNASGRLIPDLIANPDWDLVGKQVVTSSLPSNPQHRNSELVFYRLPGENKWVAYVPEMELAPINADGSFPESRTHVNVRIEAPDNDEFNMQVYNLHFGKYDADNNPSIPDDSWNHILRNHIYRYTVTKIGIDAEIELHVVPWTLDEDESWDFTDHVTIAQMLEWTAGSYESLDPETGRLLLWIDANEEDTSKILEGTFRIRTPINGIWYARLTPLDDANPNAITFVDEQGDVIEPSHGVPPVCLETSGVIEREVPAYIRIKPTSTENQEMSAFKLEFFVENLNVWMRVPLVKDGYSFPYYIIVRKGNKIIS